MLKKLAVFSAAGRKPVAATLIENGGRVTAEAKADGTFGLLSGEKVNFGAFEGGRAEAEGSICGKFAAAIFSGDGRALFLPSSGAAEKRTLTEAYREFSKAHGRKKTHDFANSPASDGGCIKMPEPCDGRGGYANEGQNLRGEMSEAGGRAGESYPQSAAEEYDDYAIATENYYARVGADKGEKPPEMCEIGHFFKNAGEKAKNLSTGYPHDVYKNQENEEVGENKTNRAFVADNTGGEGRGEGAQNAGRARANGEIEGGFDRGKGACGDGGCGETDGERGTLCNEAEGGNEPSGGKNDRGGERGGGHFYAGGEGRVESGGYYGKVKKEMTALLSAYPRANGLEALVPGASFVKIPYAGGKHYVAGVISDNGRVTSLVFGVPYDGKVTLDGAYFMPASPFESGGYLLLYQSADDGKVMKNPSPLNL